MDRLLALAVNDNSLLVVLITTNPLSNFLSAYCTKGSRISAYRISLSLSLPSMLRLSAIFTSTSNNSLKRVRSFTFISKFKLEAIA